jgi:hypothetical protein
MHAIGEVLLCELSRHGAPGSYPVRRQFAECEYCNVYEALIRAGTNGKGSARKAARNHDTVLLLQARGCERIPLLSGHHSDSRLHSAQG